MPLIQHKIIQPEGELGVWQMDETELWFFEQLILYPAELRQLGMIRGRRRQEWLAARHLVHVMSGRKKRCPFVKDEYGKPFLKDADWHISISHSHPLAAAIASPHLCGIDIQNIVPKITRLAHKFLGSTENESIQENTRLEQLHFFWCAKEAIYKAYGRRQLDFRGHIFIDPPSSFDLSGQTTGRVEKDGMILNFDVYYTQAIPGNMLVWALEVIG